MKQSKALIFLCLQGLSLGFTFQESELSIQPNENYCRSADPANCASLISLCDIDQLHINVTEYCPNTCNVCVLRPACAEEQCGSNSCNGVTEPNWCSCREHMCTTDESIYHSCPVTCNTCNGTASKYPASCGGTCDHPVCDKLKNMCGVDKFVSNECPSTCGTCPQSSQKHHRTHSISRRQSEFYNDTLLRCEISPLRCIHLDFDVPNRSSVSDDVAGFFLAEVTRNELLAAGLELDALRAFGHRVNAGKIVVVVEFVDEELVGAIGARAIATGLIVTTMGFTLDPSIRTGLGLDNSVEHLLPTLSPLPVDARSPTFPLPPLPQGFTIATIFPILPDLDSERCFFHTITDDDDESGSGLDEEQEEEEDSGSGDDTVDRNFPQPECFGIPDLWEGCSCYADQFRCGVLAYRTLCAAACNACIAPTRSPTNIPTSTPTSSMPTLSPTTTPSNTPTHLPSQRPTGSPTLSPSQNPSSSSPSMFPSVSPSQSPTFIPTLSPTSSSPTRLPSRAPTTSPTSLPSAVPSIAPSSSNPTATPTMGPNSTPSAFPSVAPSVSPSRSPTSANPSTSPTVSPTLVPSFIPTSVPSYLPTTIPTNFPSGFPSVAPSKQPSRVPTLPPSTSSPSTFPSVVPTMMPTTTPTESPTFSPTFSPTSVPTVSPSLVPTSSSPSSTPSSSPSGYPSSVPSISPTEAWEFPIIFTYAGDFNEVFGEVGGTEEAETLIISLLGALGFPVPSTLQFQPGSINLVVGYDSQEINEMFLAYVCTNLGDFNFEYNDFTFGVILLETECPSRAPSQQPTSRPTVVPSAAVTAPNEDDDGVEAWVFIVVVVAALIIGILVGYLCWRCILRAKKEDGRDITGEGLVNPEGVNVSKGGDEGYIMISDSPPLGRTAWETLPDGDDLSHKLQHAQIIDLDEIDVDSPRTSPDALRAEQTAKYDNLLFARSALSDTMQIAFEEMRKTQSPEPSPKRPDSLDDAMRNAWAQSAQTPHRNTKKALLGGTLRLQEGISQSLEALSEGLAQEDNNSGVLPGATVIDLDEDE